MTADDLRDTAKDTGERVRDTAGQAGGESAAVGSSLADKASEVAAQVKDAVGAALDKARDQMPGSASDAVDAGKRAYSQGGENLGLRVARQPLEALLLAGAIGYLVGWATNRS